MRAFRKFNYKDAAFRIFCEYFNAVTDELVRQRAILEEYICSHPEFAAAMTPLPVLPGAPEVACRMAAAAQLAGVGPMAAVAGCMAEFGALAGLRAGAGEVVVENGGDIYLACTGPIIVGLYTGSSALAGQLALRVKPEAMPLSICSSSGCMGRSLSLGRCDLATVCCKDAALADAAATYAANLVKEPGDIDRALEKVKSIPGVLGLLLVKDDRVGMIGHLPELVRQSQG